jgi:hypothetical protein
VIVRKENLMKNSNAETVFMNSMRGHILFPEELISKMYRLYETQEMPQENIIVPLKVYFPSGWTWYLYEYYEKEGLFFGLVVGFETEYGYVSKKELENLLVGINYISRDINWISETKLIDIVNRKVS